MPCFHPLRAYFAKDANASGKRSLVFKRDSSLSGRAFKIGCGRCVGCRLERSRQWAMRCVHESKLHRLNCFLTLTYDDEFLPKGGTLVKRDLQLFMKRLRKEFGNGIRFFACGEYGAVGCRPHYHILLFGCDFPDKRVYRRSGGKELYYSVSLSRIWRYGFNVIGNVDFDSCAYVARYVVDKVDGERAVAHYGGREPEFVLMSRRPGLGTGWFNKYGEAAYRMDSVVFRGREMLPPRFYDSKLAPDYLVKLKRKRSLRALAKRADGTVDRLRVREQVILRNLARIKRGEG